MIDPEDQRGIRMAVTAVISVVSAGLAAVLALAFIGSGCRATACDIDAWLMLGLLMAWPPAIGVLVGRMVYVRSFGTKVAVAFMLAWLAAHFLAPAAFFTAHVAVLDAFGGGLDAWAMLVWLTLGAVMVAAGWFGADLAQRVR